MSILVNRRAIKSGGTTLFLPPFNSPQPFIGFERDTKIVSVPFAGSSIVYNRAVGRTIDIAFDLHASSIGAALAAQDNIESILQTSAGVANSVEFCEWVDDTNTYNRIYRNAQLVGSGPEWGEAVSEKHRRCTFQLYVPSPLRYNTWASGTRPGTSPYETYLLNGVAVGDGGEGGGDGSGNWDEPDPLEVPVPQAVFQSITAIFPGVPIAGTSSQLRRAVFCGGNSVNVTGIEVTGCTSSGGSSTVIRVSDSAHGAGGNYITITLASGSTTATLVTGSFSVAEGATIYAYIQTAGGHGDIQIQINMESA